MLMFPRTEYQKCAVLLVRDLETQRICRLHDFTKAQLIRPRAAYCVAGNVCGPDKLYVGIESVRPDAKHLRSSTVPAAVAGAGGRVGYGLICSCSRILYTGHHGVTPDVMDVGNGRAADVKPGGTAVALFRS